MQIERYYAPQTRAVRPRWLPAELGLPYSLHPLDLAGGKRNPAHPPGSVPAVRVDAQVMLESVAIRRWPADRFPAHGLAPAPNDRARMGYEQWMFFVPATREPPAFDVVLHTQLLPEKHRVHGIAGFAQRGYRGVPRMLAGQLADSACLPGDRFSCADIVPGSMLTRLPGALKPFPAPTACVERVTARPAYRRAMQPVPTDDRR